MTENRNLILLGNKIPIRTISEPFCKICMNPIDEFKDLCDFCSEFPHPKMTDWYFNRIVSLGTYKTYQNENYNNIPLNIISKIPGRNFVNLKFFELFDS